MKTYVDFMAAGMFGLEDGNTQEGQLEINPVVDNREETETIIDKIGDHCEVDAVDSVSANIDFVDPELEADIKAIEEATDGDIMSGADLFLDKEDPYNEIPGGADLSNDTDETVNGFDDIAEYASDVNETEVTGTQDNLDEVMREQFDQGENDIEDYAGSITGPADNQEMIGEDTIELDDPTEETETLADNANELEETNESALDGEEDNADISDVVGVESDNGEFEEEEPVEEVEEEIEEDESEAEEEVEDANEEIEEDNEEIEEMEEPSEEAPEETTEEYEEEEDIPSETNCAEEYEMLGSLKVEIQDNNYIDDEKMEEIKSEGEEVELGSNSAFAEVSEMRDVNGVDGEVQDFDSEAVPGEGETPTEIGDGSNMSDVVGEMLAENSHGEEDGYEEGDISADGEGEYSEGEASYDDMNDTSEHDDEYEVDEMPEESEEVEDEINEPSEEAPEESYEEPVEETTEEYEEEEEDDYTDVE